MKFNYEFVKSYVEQRGYNLLSKEYTSSQVKLEISCKNGHVINPTFSEFKRKDRCNDCSGNKKPTIESINKFIEPRGFKLVSTEYINNSSKLQVRCHKDHIWEISWLNLKSGNGCPECYGNKKYSTEEVNNHLKNSGYSFKNPEDYKSTSKKVTVICPNNHDYTVRIHDFMRGVRCGACSHQTSKAEQEILKFINEYYPSAKKVKFYEINDNYSKENRNKELDIYIPELNVAIEYCGLFWHSEASGPKQSNQHRNKLTLCRQNNVRLITIFEDEWLSRQEQVKNLLLSVLNINSVKVGARECQIKKIQMNEAKLFIDNNHIQGLYTCEVSFGLFYNDELVGVISGNRHHRQSQASFVLQRLCFKKGYQIQGGASKLLKALRGHVKALGYSEIVSWSDNRISEGNVYQKLGFALKAEYDHDYSYVLDGSYNRRHSKQSLKKTPEERLTGKTEWELRKNQGYYRIWDCGKKAWILDIS